MRSLEGIAEVEWEEGAIFLSEILLFLFGWYERGKKGRDNGGLCS